MVSLKYEYETSPRKLEPNERKKEKKAKLRIVEELPRGEIKISKEQRKKQKKLILFVAIIFVVLLTISYRNSQINEKFNNNQNLKKELSSLEKENEQLKVNIANGLNLNNIEKMAKEKLGMQKLTNKQIVYVNLPKKDYVEAASEEVVLEEKSWFEQILEKINEN